MKNKVLIIIVSLLMAGCSDFLEPKSQTLFIPKDAISLNEMLLGSAYSRPGTYTARLNALLQFLDDDITCTDLTGKVSTSNVAKMNAYKAIFSWQPDMFEQMSINNEYRDIWESHYRLILGTNAALDYIDKVEGTFNEKTLIKGQAHALRAFYFFHLVNYFGEPYNYNKQAWGIPLKLNSGTEQTEIVRSTVEEVYEQILSDLDEAERNYKALPANLQYRPDLRTSLPMVQLLKSRVYLYMENWKDAAVYAQKVIKEWDFFLFDLNTLTPGTGWSRVYYPMVSRTSPEAIWLYGAAGSDITLNFILELTPSYRKIFNASQELMNGFSTGDLRKELYVFRESGTYDNVFMPYGKLATSSGTSIDQYAFLGAFRLSEAYLNLAEAAAMDKDETTAKDALDRLREKRFTPETYVKINETGDALVDKIRLERRLELCFEDHRWFDLRRQGMPEFIHKWNAGEGTEIYKISKNDPGYTLPIPDRVILENRALVQNKLRAKN